MERVELRNTITNLMEYQFSRNNGFAYLGEWKDSVNVAWIPVTSLTLDKIIELIESLVEVDSSLRPIVKFNRDSK